MKRGALKPEDAAEAPRSANSNATSNGKTVAMTRRRRRRATNVSQEEAKMPAHATFIFVSIMVFVAAFFAVNAYLLSRIEGMEKRPKASSMTTTLRESRRSPMNDPPEQNHHQQQHHDYQKIPADVPIPLRMAEVKNSNSIMHNNDAPLRKAVAPQTFEFHPSANENGDYYNLRRRVPLAENNQPTMLHNSTEIIDMRQLSHTLPFDNPDGGVWKQGWDVAPRVVDDANPLHIYVVPHSHCDPGWLKTFDEYFQLQTKKIISSVVEALLADPQRTFIWAEISFFSWWWEEKSESTHEQVRTLLRNGQFEFVTGGWVQPDEANSNMDALEIQMQEGHDWIAKHVGKEFLPRVGWSIDPFGYSPSLPYLLKSQFNFDAILIQRVHYAVKKELAKRKHLEFYWRQTWDTNGEYDMFTHLMPFYSYDVPHTCGPDPSVCCQFDFARSPLGKAGRCPWKKNPKNISDDNVEERARLILDQYLKKSNLYRGNAVLIPLGDDFRYQTLAEAENQYTNYQKVFDYINHYVPGVKIQFGTLSQYFGTVRETFQTPILKGSFFTYSDVNNDYWSGYFTSRVFDKALDRQLERAIFAAESLGASRDELQDPRRQLSLFQHHDGVTGTARTPVVKDYAKRMYNAIQKTQQVMLEKMKERNSELSAAVIDDSKKGGMFTSAPIIEPCWRSDDPRGLSENMCSDGERAFVYNPLLDSVQFCADLEVEGGQVKQVTLPCETPGPLGDAKSRRPPEFDERTGLMTWPVKEEWNVWAVTKGGAYLFVPGQMHAYDMKDVKIAQGGFVVETKQWRRIVIERPIPTNVDASVYDFVYEINLQEGNREWFVRLSADIQSKGVFYTDLNGFNFDTHFRRDDLPIQSQVFPMPAHAAIQDSQARLTVLSEHAQGTASLKDGAIDLFLDRRLNQDDARGLGQGVQDNVATRTRFRVVVERGGFDGSEGSEFQITPFCREEWNQLNHPLEIVGHRTKKEMEHHISVEVAVPVSNGRGANRLRPGQIHHIGLNNRGRPVPNNGAIRHKGILPGGKEAGADNQLEQNRNISPGYAAMYGEQYGDLTSNDKKDNKSLEDKIASIGGMESELKALDELERNAALPKEIKDRVFKQEIARAKARLEHIKDGKLTT